MPAPKPSRTPASVIKEKLLKPAMTSHFECHFNPPGALAVIGSDNNSFRDWSKNRDFDFADANNEELIRLSCTETSLPGSRLATNTLQDDHHGVTERHAYRRQFDDVVSFTFHVDAPKVDGDPGYKIIWFFEQWKAYIMNEGNNNKLLNSIRLDPWQHQDGTTTTDDKNWYYRAKFPDTYQTELFITKFERDYDLSKSDYAKKGNGGKSTKKYLEYKFMQAFPISINTMPVSNDASQLLKCSVSFAFSRYVVRRRNALSSSSSSDTRKVDSGLIYDKEKNYWYNPDDVLNPNSLNYFKGGQIS